MWDLDQFAKKHPKLVGLAWIVLIPTMTIGFSLVFTAAMNAGLDLASLTGVKVRAGDFEGMFAAFGAVVGIGSLMIAIGLFWQGEKIARLNHRAEVIIHCIERYDRISDRESKLDLGRVSREARKKIVEHYYGQLYGLKSDQFDFFLAGWVDVDTFVGWLRSSLRALRHDREAYGVGAREGWGLVAGYHEQANPFFFDIMKNLNRIAVHPTAWSQPEGEGRIRNAERAFREIFLNIDAESPGAKRLIQSDYTATDYFRQIDGRKTTMVNDEVINAILDGATDAEIALMKRKLRKAPRKAGVTPRIP